jgi:repressor LexA
MSGKFGLTPAFPGLVLVLSCMYLQCIDRTIIMAKNLTHRQREILKFISDHIDKHGFPPTRNDISAHFGFRSPNAAQSHLRALEKKEMLQIGRHRSRGIALTAPAIAQLPGAARRHIPLPLVGNVAAGSPILAEQNIEKKYQLDPNMFSPRPDYLLRVHGTSMRDVGILDGDLLAVHRTPEARNGQIVVARIDDEVTVKRFSRDAHRVWLSPENPAYEPIEIDLRQQELHIEGLGVGVIRNQMTS